MTEPFHSPEAILRRFILRPVGLVTPSDRFADRLLERFWGLPTTAWPVAWGVIAHALADSLESSGWTQEAVQATAHKILCCDLNPPNRSTLYSLWVDAGRVLDGHRGPLPCPITPISPGDIQRCFDA